MSPVESIQSVLSKYAVFSGRARRSEFWWFVLADGIVSTVFYAIAVGPAVVSSYNNGEATSPGAGFFVYMLFTVAMFLPRLAVLVRRLHDTNRAGIYYFVGLIPFVGPFILLYFLAQAGTVGENGAGPDPKA